MLLFYENTKKIISEFLKCPSKTLFTFYRFHKKENQTSYSNLDLGNMCETAYSICSNVHNLNPSHKSHNFFHNVQLQVIIKYEKSLLLTFYKKTITRKLGI